MDFKEDWYQNMLNKFEVEVFSKIYYLKNRIKRDVFMNLLDLLNESYSPFICYVNDLTIDQRKEKKPDWKFLIFSEFNLETTSYIELNLKIPIFIQTGNQVKLNYSSDNGIRITLEKDERYGFVLIFDLYPNAYLNENHIETFNKNTNKWISTPVNQTLAAKRNREILANFLKEMCLLFHRIPFQYESLKFNRDYLYEYGFKPNIKL